MNTELLLIITLQKQKINKADKVSFIKLKKLITLFLLCKENERNKVKRKYWGHPIFSSEKRNTLIRELYFHNDEKFINYFCMNIKTYDIIKYHQNIHHNKKKSVFETQFRQMPPCRLYQNIMLTNCVNLRSFLKQV